jgi:mRNA interferase MazF
MTNYQRGDLLLVDFPFVHAGKAKQRPALVVADTGDNDVVLARVTTQSQGSAFDVAIANWKAAGLLAPSVVRLHKLATIDKSLVQRRLGKLTGNDRTNVAAAITQFCSGW